MVIGRRLLDLGLWSRDEFFAFYAQQRKRWQKKRDKLADSNGGNYYATKALKVGRSFLQHVDTAARNGALTYSEAYRLTGAKRGTYKNAVGKLIHQTGGAAGAK